VTASELATLLAVDARTAKEPHRGKRRWTTDQRALLLDRMKMGRA
jgi:hypothetical protein